MHLAALTDEDLILTDPGYPMGLICPRSDTVHRTAFVQLSSWDRHTCRWRGVQHATDDASDGSRHDLPVGRKPASGRDGDVAG